MEEDVRNLKELLDVFYKEKDTTWITIHTPQIKNIENILNELERLQKENKKLISDNLEYQRIQDIFDKRTYRKKYLEERRKEEPSLLYPDADEIYQRYYKLKKENEELKETRIDPKEYGSMKIRLANSIPKSVIQDEIDELVKNKNQLDEINRTFRLYTVYDSYDLQANVLQELLNKGE